jgi:hypothetical protein
VSVQITFRRDLSRYRKNCGFHAGLLIRFSA